MALGIHSFYALPTHNPNSVENKADYFIGRYVGDHYADDDFRMLLQRVEKRLRRCYNNNFQLYWSPMHEQQRQPRTAAQKCQTAIKKAVKKSERIIKELRQQNYLFENDFIAGEQQKLQSRIELLRNRYSAMKENR